MITRKTSDVGGLFPEVVEILRSDFQIPLCCLDLKLRHPLAIYNVSLQRVLDDFGEVLDEFDRLMAEKSFLGIVVDPPVWNTDLTNLSWTLRMTTLRQCSSRWHGRKRLSKTLRLFECRPDLKTFEKSQNEFFRYDAVGKLEELRCVKSR